MPRYRMEIRAVLCFDVEASSEEEAKRTAVEAAGRLDEGIECEDPDPEDEATDVVAYPDSERLGPRVIEMSESED